MKRNLVKQSKFLSLILRHKPETIGIVLDQSGWVEIDTLLNALQKVKRPLSRERLQEIVDINDKQRFAISVDGNRIRANQGHSIDIDLQLAPQSPPAQLFHGTAQGHLPSIRQQGLLKGKRQYVHLSWDRKTAIQVGRRHGKPVVLVVEADAMHAEGYSFFLSENRVWLTNCVPAKYLIFPSD